MLCRGSKGQKDLGGDGTWGSTSHGATAPLEVVL